ncbi:MAG TPA: ferrochelatase [Polyangiaceae bacterium]
MTHPRAEGVMLVAHGTVASLDEMVDFLTAIRRGRPPTPALVEEMCRRYGAIGGSPLLSATQRQAEALAEKVRTLVVVGMRFGRPTIEDALREAARMRIERLVVVPMAPYSVALYFGEVRGRRWALSPEALEFSAETSQLPFELLAIPPWGTHPLLVQAHAEQIQEYAGDALARGASLILSAHSLPMRTIEIGDQYAREVAESAEALGRRLGCQFSLAFQSQGADGGKWLGPDLNDVVRAHAERGVSEIVVAPFGFLCDHVETLFDLDVELKSKTDALSVKLVRVPALGTHATLIAALAELVAQALAPASSMRSEAEVSSC